MTSACLESRPWTLRRWWTVVAAIFVAQLGLIVWLSDKTPDLAAPAPAAPIVHLAGPAASEWLALNDPTLFALPHRYGFSGLAWLGATDSPSSYFTWSEPQSWLLLEPPQFGPIFGRLRETNDSDLPASLTRPEPELTMAEGPVLAVAPDKSVLRLEGGLAQRRLLSPINPPLQPSSDLLTNTEVRLVVDTAGRVVSVPVLLTKSGKPEADDWALRKATAARFEPVGPNGPARDKKAGIPEQLTWGIMVFEWRTIPMPNTNAP